MTRYLTKAFSIYSRPYMLMAQIVLTSIFLNTAFAYDPPIGIPEPPFGIDEVNTMYNGEQYAAGGFAYLDAGNGPYTHYIDNTASNCSDNGNSYGTAATPRCSISTNLSLPAGSVVEIHGGPYNINEFTFTGNGTAANPVFVRGIGSEDSRPIITNSDIGNITGTYFIVENLIFDQVMVITESSAQYVSVRNSEVRYHPQRNATRIGGTDVVFFNNEVHHNQGNDRHGTMVPSGSTRIWLLENYYHHNGGDGIQLCHGCQSNPPSYVYIGKNLMHSDRENGVDLKYVENVVISQNTIYAYKSAPADTNWCFDDGSGCGTYSSGSDGSAVVIGSDGAPTNPWVIYNTIYGSVNGIRVEEVYGAWIIGNVIYDHSQSAIALEKNGQPLHISNNTFYDVNTGVDQFFRENFELNMDNNIFANISGNYVNIESSSVAADSYLKNNLFWDNGNSITLRWDQNRSASTGSNIDSYTGGSGNIVADPMFVNAASGNFALREGSPAINTGNTALEAIDTQFQQIFGNSVSIKYDFTGLFRPQGIAGNSSLYDIGAYESSGDPVPMPPTGITIQ